MNHVCHALYCEVSIPPRLFVCKHHWRMVPIHLRLQVLRTYRPGQEQDKCPSRDYLQAAAQAIIAVAEAEGAHVPTIYRRMALGREE